MDFCYIQRKDGSYALVCTRCFEAVASSEDSESLQHSKAVHRCKEGGEGRFLHGGAPKVHDVSVKQCGTDLLQRARWSRILQSSWMVVAAVFLLYAIPKWLELVLVRTVNPWISVVFLGDAVGCACIIAMFKRPGLAIAVYLAATGLEALARELHLMHAAALTWVADVIPTIVAIALLVKIRQPRSVVLRNYL